MEREISIGSRANIIIWLFAGCLLIFTMVIVGGITRLTGSGLSITEWKVVTGTIPPVSEAQWLQEFSKYQSSPQFKLINSHFGLEEFKSIYWWEYIHRLIGRLIGIVFIVPFVWFLIRKQMNKTLILQSLVLFGMGGLQGFLGWYMVKSGLVDMPSVSHYRLALHLLTAFITFGLTFWFAMRLIHTQSEELSGWKKSLFRLSQLTLFAVVLQIVYGAFVAGLKAGHIYNTWPLMGDSYVPDGVRFAFNSGLKGITDNLAGVQFIHRNLAIVVALMIIGLWLFARNKNKSASEKISNGQWMAIHFCVGMVMLQFALGVFTLLYNVPVWLGVVHQAGAFILFASVIYLVHRLRRRPVMES